MDKGYSEALSLSLIHSYLGVYTVAGTDDLGKDIARMTATCYR